MDKRDVRRRGRPACRRTKLRSVGLGVFPVRHRPGKSEAARRGGFQTRPRQDGQGYVPCKGLIVWSGRREAPIRCGFARTYAPERRKNEPIRHVHPLTRQHRTIPPPSRVDNQTPVQVRSEKWGCEVQPLRGDTREVGLRPCSTPSLKRPGRACSSALARPAATTLRRVPGGQKKSGLFLAGRPLSLRRRWSGPAPPRAGCRARRPRPRRGRSSAWPRPAG
jgi:hypothetical protein